MVSIYKTFIPIFFEAPSHVQEVIVTGTFDKWGKTKRMERSNGESKLNLFSILLELNDDQDDKGKIIFKFLQDGEWTISNQYRKDYSEGYENNVIEYRAVLNKHRHREQRQLDAYAAYFHNIDSIFEGPEQYAAYWAKFNYDREDGFEDIEADERSSLDERTGRKRRKSKCNGLVIFKWVIDVLYFRRKKERFCRMRRPIE